MFGNIKMIYFLMSLELDKGFYYIGYHFLICMFNYQQVLRKRICFKVEEDYS